MPDESPRPAHGSPPDYRQVKCPLLVVLATDDLPEQQPFQELYAAYPGDLALANLNAELAAISEELSRRQQTVEL